jgi:hypothetical protein
LRTAAVSAVPKSTPSDVRVTRGTVWPSVVAWCPVCDPSRVSKEVREALEAFTRRIGVYEPQADPAVRIAVDGEEIALSTDVARALIKALAGYHDDRDRGDCEHCGGGRLDDNFLCRDCGRPNGVFGAMLAERASRYEGDPAALAEFTWGEPKPEPVSLPTLPPPPRPDDD